MELFTGQVTDSATTMPNLEVSFCKLCADIYEGSFGDGENYSQDFHLFAVDWSYSEIQFSVDYKVYWTVPSSQFTPWVPFYMILNTAVGGDWPGSPDAYTTFPQYHYIDYVRVYQN